MNKWILRNWLILAVISLLTGFWIAFAEDFVRGKAYLYFILAIVFAFVYLKKSGRLWK
jgi:hypothetical protein